MPAEYNAKYPPTAKKFIHLKVLNVYARLIEEFPVLNELLVSMPDGSERFWNYEDMD